MTERARRPIVAGNWKMNTTITEAVDLAEAIERLLGQVTEIDVLLLPPFPNLDAVNEATAGSALQLGAQDIFWEDAGAYTGEVSGPMLAAVGCAWALVGHSERRRLLGESSEVVNRKMRAALRNDLNVILAMGETREERQENRMESVLREQITGSLKGVTAEEMERVVLAYEPVWAIGTGDTASPEQAREAHAFVRQVLRDLYGEDVAEMVRIQYGGSVTPQNAAELLTEPGIDGALVGGASLRAADFSAIAHAAISTL